MRSRGVWRPVPMWAEVAPSAPGVTSLSPRTAEARPTPDRYPDLVRIHAPHLFGRTRGDASTAFVVLFTLDSACRALLITIVPQQAYALLGSAQLVTLLYLAASVGGLAASLAVPAMLQWWGRRRVVTVAVLGFAATCAMLATGRLEGLVAALILQTLVTAAIEIVVNLYLLENVARRDLNRFEPLRLLFAGSAYVIGPWLGVALHHRVAEGLTYLVVVVLLAIFLAFFLTITAERGGTGASPKEPAFQAPASPLAHIRRYAAQPRLVLAWVLAIGRNGWWLMYFIYTPILVDTFGYGPEVGGMLVSIGLLPMFAVRIWAAVGHRHGIRKLLIAGYLTCGIATLAVGAMAHWPLTAMALICLASLFATMIDGAGNVPFLRAVRPLERSEMTAVFMTFRHVAALALPALFAGVLWVAPLPFVFVTSGVIAIGMAGLARNLPRGL